jgi:hypothetical protein
MNPNLLDTLMMNSKLYGEYYTIELKDYFNYGELVKVYSHYSYRLFTIGKDDKIFKIHHSEFGKVFFTKEDWRNKKINKIIKK